jgi:hypothetical protein
LKKNAKGGGWVLQNTHFIGGMHSISRFVEEKKEKG